MKIYTIGFTQKSAETFFGLLVSHGIKKVLDVRLNNTSQFTRFTHRDDLPYFLSLHNIGYEHLLICAPTKELLSGYRKGKISWEDYVKIYIGLLEQRDILGKIKKEDIVNAVLLCAEASAERCHRRLLAEYLAHNLKGIEIVHL